MNKIKVFLIVLVIFIISATIIIVAFSIAKKERSMSNDGNKYLVQYVPKEAIYPAFGYNGSGRAIVREDLSPRIKQFVTAHELYHLQDTATWGGWLGRELRANIVPGMSDPIGLAATVWSSIFDIDRISFYLQRFKKGY